MPHFRRKPAVIEAVQFTGRSVANFNEVEEFVGGDIGKDSQGEMVDATLKGALHVSPGDWIIKGVQGEFYPIKDAIFRETYELAHAPSPSPESGRKENADG